MNFVPDSASNSIKQAFSAAPEMSLAEEALLSLLTYALWLILILHFGMWLGLVYILVGVLSWRFLLRLLGYERMSANSAVYMYDAPGRVTRTTRIVWNASP